MRPKYFSMLAIFLSILILAAAAWLELAPLRGERLSFRAEPVMPLAELKVPPKSVLEQMDYLERRMHMLSAPPPQIRQRVDLSGLGYVPLVAADPGQAAGESAENTGPDYQLTLAFDGRVKRYCVIDDRLYAEGAVLPDGATIVKIESRRVLIAKESLRQWLNIAPLPDTELAEES